MTWASLGLAAGIFIRDAQERADGLSTKPGPKPKDWPAAEAIAWRKKRTRR